MRETERGIIEEELANAQAAIGGLEMVAERPDLAGRTAAAMWIMLSALSQATDRIEQALTE